MCVGTKTYEGKAGRKAPHLLLQGLGHDEDLLLGVLLDPPGEDSVACIQAHEVSELVGALGHT